MKLQLTVKNGKRKGEVFSLLSKDRLLEKDMVVILENEIIQFDLHLSKFYHSAELELYHHRIPVSRVSKPIEQEEDEVLFTWLPENTLNYTTTNRLFWNYFGVAELMVHLFNDKGNLVQTVEFQALQVVAAKSQAENVEKMFEYLAKISPETIHTIFSASKNSAGYSEGDTSLSQMLEQLEHVLVVLQKLLPRILRNPLTRLLPEHRLTVVSGREELDDTSIGWLLENLSVLEPANRSDESHLIYDGDHYKANSLLLPELKEVSDIYENWVIHSFIDLLIHTANNLREHIGKDLWSKVSSSSVPSGYISFFQKAAKFKTILLGEYLQKIDNIVSTLKKYKYWLDKELPVNRIVNGRPLMTPKVLKQQSYRQLFIEIIRWHELGEVDWSAYQYLFAIESIPVLFETYSYIRVLESVNRYLYKQVNDEKEEIILKNTFVDRFSNEIRVFREPVYWAVDHSSQHPEHIVNSEAYTINRNSINARGQTGGYSKRVPDIVLQIKQANGLVKLIVLDAKYSYADKSFRDYLPQLTMRYVHGIHRVGQKESLVDALSILYPDDDGGYRDYHYGDFGVFGDYPVAPALLCCGVILGESRLNDYLYRLLKRILELQGIKPLVESVKI